MASRDIGCTVVQLLMLRAFRGLHVTRPSTRALLRVLHGDGGEAHDEV
jgi:hypothetical protein